MTHSPSSEPSEHSEPSEPSEPSDVVDLFGGTPAPPAPKSTRRLFPVPALDAGLVRSQRCTGDRCNTTMYWVQGIKFPISCEPDGCSHPTSTTEGRGVNHYSDCPDAPKFSGRNRSARASSGGRHG